MAKKTASAAIGHNTDNAARDRRILFAYYHKKDRELAAKIKATQTEKASNRQNAKASGFPSQKLDHYLKSFLSEDQQKPVDKLKSDREDLEWLGLIPATSGGDLLKQIDRVDNEEMTRSKGFHAGLTGMDRVSGYDGGSVDDKLWLESYDAGKTEYDTVLPDLLKGLDDAAKKDAATDGGIGEDPF